MIVVIGSGVSRHALGHGSLRPPMWEGFLRQAIIDCPNRDSLGPIEEAVASGDYLHACEWLKKRYDENWVSYLRRTFSAPAYAPAEIHEQILRLDARIVFSLNFDVIYERHANNIHHGSHIVKNYYDTDVSEFLRGGGRYIIKVHGNLNSPESLIFTQKDYARARIKHAAFYQAFDAALLTHTFLFIGSGYSDPDINLLLENQNFGFPSQLPHYFLSGNPMHVDRRASLRDNRNIKVLEYDRIDDAPTGLVAELIQLNSILEPEIEKMGTTNTW
ncbi:SIR2 family protein [Methylobacterium isbiliense]|uniref:SIR2 family protein n=1 Tax=Methylobacterium isbiliense TaxID=315478 RepID=UPI0025B5DB4B|nr:SIR2 family protein [Methylobacterium isbiliense]MDN3622715.1 SIR2 family protein [Methylobacterium isbiliense]